LALWRSPTLVLIAVLAMPGVARADGEGVATFEHSSLLDRPHTVAAFEAGIVALPTAPISSSNRGGSTPILGSIGKGDATLLIGAHLLYRAGRDWAIGASSFLAPNPTTDPNYSAGASSLPRTHSRSYLFLGGEARYFPLRYRWFEGWVGVTTGAIIVSDRFANNSGDAVPTILGRKEVTVSTEGFAVGVQVGGDYLINDNLVVGLALRADRWILPEAKPFSQDPACDAIGDCPTLTGTVAAFEVGLTIAYRIPL
jgi:hypothetical protein